MSDESFVVRQWRLVRADGASVVVTYDGEFDEWSMSMPLGLSSCEDHALERWVDTLGPDLSVPPAGWHLAGVFAVPAQAG